MESSNYLLLNTSILYRCAQKFYDRQLENKEISAGQILFLILIYEQEGLSMQQLSLKGAFDKGTITRSIQKLEELGYVQSKVDKNDKRIRHLYTSDKTREIISSVYMVRREWWERLTKNLTKEEIQQFETIQAKITQNALQYDVETRDTGLKIFGMQKLTLLDYPGKMASTIFTGGCNFRCPFCHNADLVFLPENTAELKLEEVFTFLKKRVGILEGICISGGEPLLQDDLCSFIKEIKKLGYDVKLDTNGTQPDKLAALLQEGLLDYVAMDIKNSKEHYGETAGILHVAIETINRSVQLLMKSGIPYEFRTTIVKEFHQEEDMHAIGRWLKGAQAYYLQNFEDGDCVIQKGLHAVDEDTLKSYAAIVRSYVPNTMIRGL